jgi:hypothetical protein
MSWGRLPTAFAVLAASLTIASTAHAELGGRCYVPGYLSAPAAKLPRATIAAKRDRKLDILLISGSPTQTGGSKGLRAYPSYFEAALRERFPALEIQTVVRSAPRRLVSDLVPKLKDILSEVKPSLVIWQAGTADANRGVDVEDFAAALRSGVSTVLRSGADVLLIDMQYSPRTDKMVDSESYLENMREIADTTDVPLFDRYSIMRYWNDSGAFDLTSLKNDGLYEKIHQCIGGLLADFVVRATSLEEFKGAAK